MKKIALLIMIPLFLFSDWNFYRGYTSYLNRRAKYCSNSFFKADTNRKIVALTFDDGPMRKTPRIMRVLSETKTPATFFLIAKNINRRYAKLFKNRLFSVGMHTYSHRNFDHYSQKTVNRDFQKAIARFKKYGLDYHLFRPAYGVANYKVKSSVERFGLKSILWSNDTKDWSRSRSYKRVIKRLTAGDIILMHDHATSPRKLRQLIDAIHKKGFKIVPLNEILKYRSAYPLKRVEKFAKINQKGK